MLQKGLIRTEFKPAGHKVFLLLAVAVIKHCRQALLGTVAYTEANSIATVFLL